MKALLLAVGCSVLFLLGCPGDIDWPEIDLVEVYDGEVLVTSIEPSGSEDTTIQDDVPSTAHFALTFSEPMDMLTAEDKIHIWDERHNEEEITLDPVRNVISVRTVDGFLPEGNNVLEVEDGVEDTSGYNLLRHYRINYYVP